MATITTVSHGSMKNSPRREYIAARVFNNDFYTYTTSLNQTTFVTIGTLAPVTSNASLTPVGRVLRENGKKLYPGAYPGVSTYLVGVYDDQTGLSGYINPNSAVFAVFNTDKPTYLTDGSEVSGGTYSGQNQGNSLYTRGTVTAGATVTAGTGLVATTGGLTVSAGAVTLPVTSGAAVVGTLTANGASSVVVNNSLVTANSFILLSLASAPVGVTASTAYVFARTAGTSFTIRAAAGDLSTYNYLIVN